MQSRPARVLIHPLWVGSLALLFLNDHVWKGAGVLPTALTGKLSDVVGLIVAPMLLAAMLRLRSRAGLGVAHVATGAGFAALQLSPGLAALVAEGSTLAGLPFVTTPDPSDLLALPALVLSWIVLEPESRSRRPLRPALQRIAGAAGLVTCIATSSQTPPDGFRDVWAEMVLFNDTDVEQEVRLRRLHPGVLLDCAHAELRAAPGTLLTDALFGPVELWSLPPGTIGQLSAERPFTIDDSDPDRECEAVLLASDRMGPHVVVWDATEVRFFPGEPPPDAGLEVDVISLAALESGAGDDRAHPVDRSDAPDQCLADPLARTDWTLEDMRGTLVELVESGDGCHELIVEDPFNGILSGYLCVPFDLVPFSPGATIDVTTEVADGQRTLHIDESGLRNRMVVASITGPITTFGIDATPVRDPAGSCGISVHPACGHVATEVGLLVSADGVPAELLPGDILDLSEGRRLALQFGEERIVHNVGCGDPFPGLELDIVMTQQIPDEGAL